jgi:DNA primase
VAGRILKEDIDALRQQADIVAIIGDYTSLRRAGKSFKGLCPFHTERTPSFTCTPDGNFFHCFGCGASGDIYDFLQRVEGLDFPEAVETLARRTGFPLRYEQLTTREKRAIGERSRLVAVSHLARDHFVQRLLGDEGLVRATTSSHAASDGPRPTRSSSASRPSRGTTCRARSSRTGSIRPT